MSLPSLPMIAPRAEENFSGHRSGPTWGFELTQRLSQALADLAGSWQPPAWRQSEVLLGIINQHSVAISNPQGSFLGLREWAGLPGLRQSSQGTTAEQVALFWSLRTAVVLPAGTKASRYFLFSHYRGFGLWSETSCLLLLSQALLSCRNRNSYSTCHLGGDPLDDGSGSSKPCKHRALL